MHILVKLAVSLTVRCKVQPGSVPGPQIPRYRLI